MSPLEIVVFILVLIIFIVGLAGIILPILPGIPLIFAGIVLFAVVNGFRMISWEWVIVCGVLTVIGLGVDYAANYLGVKKMGGSRAGAIGAVLGLIIGIFVHPIAIIIFPFVLAVSFELLMGRTTRQAVKAGTGAWIGLLFGGLMRFVIGCTMIGIFFWCIVF
jgi:uncharacterized protein YqgC (DUF456 family)